jgi:Putative Flp pilus-assembly TadE/G-like
MARITRDEHGSILIMAVLALVMIGAFLAMTVSVGRRHAVRGSLQNGVDSAALAGAAELDGYESGLTSARDSAVQMAAQHITDSALKVDVKPESDLLYGHWYHTNRIFCPFGYWTGNGFNRVAYPAACSMEAYGDVSAWTDTQLFAITNAVKVQSARSGATAVPVAFGGAFLPQEKMAVKAEGIAVGGGPCEEKCTFPLAFGDCLITPDKLDPDKPGNVCDQVLPYVFSNDPSDNTALSSLAVGVAVTQGSFLDAAKTTCAGSESKGDTDIPLQNGNDINQIARDSFIQSLFGKTTEPAPLTVPVIHCEPGFKGNRVRTIVGYTDAILCYVTGSNPPTFAADGSVVRSHGPGPTAPWPQTGGCGPPPGTGTTPAATGETWYLRHLCRQKRPPGGSWGCGFLGISPRYQLVGSPPQ